MKDYNHNGKIDSEDELLLQKMIEDGLNASSERYSFSDGLKRFVLVTIGFLILMGLTKAILRSNASCIYFGRR